MSLLTTLFLAAAGGGGTQGPWPLAAALPSRAAVGADLGALLPLGVPPVLAESYLRPYLPVALFVLVLAGMGGTLLWLSRVLGPQRVRQEKLTTYECGAPLFGEARQQFSVKFYLVAILFVLFDIESVFLIPWAVIYRDIGFAAVAEMLFFVGVLALGFVYAWKRGGLDWD